jgi:hypothetical protein
MKTPAQPEKWEPVGPNFYSDWKARQPVGSFPESEDQLRYISESVRQRLLADEIDLKRGSKREAVNCIEEAIEQALADWPAHKSSTKGGTAAQ